MLYYNSENRALGSLVTEGYTVEPGGTSVVVHIRIVTRDGRKTEASED